MLPRRDIGRSALFAVFTLSGFSGLIYESATGQSAVADGLLRGYLPALQNAGRYGLAAHPVAAS